MSRPAKSTIPRSRGRTYDQIKRELLADPEHRADIERELGLLRTGLALSRARKKAGLTQAEVARTLGISQGRVSRMERAEDVNLSTLARYANALGGSLHVEVTVGDDRFAVTPPMGTSSA